MTQLQLIEKAESLTYKLRTHINEPILITANDKKRYIENKIKNYFEEVENLRKEYYERAC